MSKNRSEVALKDRWNVEALYPNLEKWHVELTSLLPQEQANDWPEISKFRGKLGNSPETLKSALETILTLDRQISKLFTYAHLRHDEEITEENHKIAYNKARTLFFDFSCQVAWFSPELLALPEKTIADYLSSPILQDYRFYLEKIFRLKPYTLSSEKEELLALAGKALSAPQKAFSAINDADLVFEPAVDAEGNKHELTHAKYALYIRSQDRHLRKSTFENYHKKFDAYKNTLCELIEGQVQTHLFHAKAKGFKSCLEAALYPNNIDPSVYKSLILAVHEKIGALHHYMRLRSNILKLEPLHMYDLHVPLIADVDMKIPYGVAEEMIIESVAPLGVSYQEVLKKGFKEEGWVDRYENLNKRSGAYSSGCFDSHPYILMNYKEIMRDAFTLAHEAGHSMHSYLSRAEQPYQYADYPIFLAEVASTFNEELLMQTLLKRVKNKQEQIYLINQKVEDVRNTLFRQTMFAEFELKIHEFAEKGVPLTPKLLKDEYRKLNEFYFGPDVYCNEETDIEWARIPHFYYNFYVFQYATGISAALALSEKVLAGGEKERCDYLTFLKSGSSRDPIELLQRAGVDMRTPEPVLAAIDKFDKMVKQIETLMS